MASQISIPVSPKTASVLQKVSGYEKKIAELLTRFCEAVADGRLTIDEIFTLSGMLVNFVRSLIKK